MKIGIDGRMRGVKQTGIGIYIENLIKNVLKLDSENEYVLFLKNIDGELESELKKYKNVKIIDADYPWYSYGEQIFFPFKIWREKLDLMHFPHFNAPIFCPVKFIVTIHDMTPKYFSGNKVGRSFFRRKMFDLVMARALLKSKKIIAVSNFTKNEILKFYPHTSGDKVEVIYEGLREEFFVKLNYTPTSNFQSLISSFIFYTGAWRSHKNLVGLIKAFKILKDKYQVIHKLVLGGSEDPNYPEVRKTWEELGLEKDIVLTGFLNLKDQIFLYRNCDLYVSPSFSEGFGFTPLEAMVCGASVALSDIPAHREISGDLPIYFDPQNQEDMAGKIYFALNNENFRQKFASQGIEFARKYRWQDCAIKTLKLYNNITKVNNA